MALLQGPLPLPVALVLGAGTWVPLRVSSGTTMGLLPVDRAVARGALWASSRAALALAALLAPVTVGTWSSTLHSVPLGPTVRGRAMKARAWPWALQWDRGWSLWDPRPRPQPPGAGARVRAARALTARGVGYEAVREAVAAVATAVVVEGAAALRPSRSLLPETTRTCLAAF